MDNDNLSQQADEIEALKSIYEDEFVQESQFTFSMQVTPAVKLFVTLHSQYPSEKPPKHELLAPELSRKQKDKVHKEFKTIYDESFGGPVLFQWIERLKEIAYTESKKKRGSSSSDDVTVINIIKTKTKVDFTRFSNAVVHGPTIEDRKSVFQGHACAVKSEADVRNFLEYLMQNKKISQATHNIYAYRTTKNRVLLQDCNDDGENHASRRLLHLLQIMDLQNVMVVVSRWYGGIQLGPDRFKHITNAARRALVEGGFLI